MWNDFKRRAPYYWSDWSDAWDYRVVPSTVYMYFAKYATTPSRFKCLVLKHENLHIIPLWCNSLLPALAFSFDMFESTGMSYGVNEVLLSSVLGAAVFSFFSAQPLTIVGVTGPITVFNYTVYDIIKERGTPYLPFMAWICLWSMVMHLFLGISNASNAVKWVTRFSCDVFGFYVAFIYLQKGIQILTIQWHQTDVSAYLSISISLLVLMVGYLSAVIGRSTLFLHPVRTFLRDYGTPLTVIFFTGYQFIGKMKGIELLQLPTAAAFKPTLDRGWLVEFWKIDVADVFLAVPFALLLTILFYFDHNVSSLICQGTEFPLCKPAGFHWDIFLLGITTGIAGILGLPAPNGLIPQAPFHTASLCVNKQIPVYRSSGASPSSSSTTISGEPPKTQMKTVTTHVVEQRFSNLAQGLLILVTMTGPLLTVLGLIPQAVLAGLFFVMGIEALESNGITHKLIFLFQDRTLTAPNHPLKKCRLKAVWAFVALELFSFGATFAITQTIAAVGFPVIILALIPLRKEAFERWWFQAGELGVLDQPTASPFTLESVGGAWGGPGEKAEEEEEEGEKEREEEEEVVEEEEDERSEMGGENGVERGEKRKSQ
ncbi:HCO3 transporter family-domain-containing protein [Kalaharituber pfeilii]|nr:HCO3 transporter family-domain-containing protein [Kalaharituber pfeilii]